MVGRSRELSGYSGGVAAANAQAEIRKLQADIREAQKIGPELARITKLEADLDITIREALVPVKKVSAEKVAVAMDLLIRALQKWLDGVKKEFASKVSYATGLAPPATTTSATTTG